MAGLRGPTADALRLSDVLLSSPLAAGSGHLAVFEAEEVIDQKGSPSGTRMAHLATKNAHRDFKSLTQQGFSQMIEKRQNPSLSDQKSSLFHQIGSPMRGQKSSPATNLANLLTRMAHLFFAKWMIRGMKVASVNGLTTFFRNAS